MSQALGLMAELDLGTEYLRWMGDKRFVLGFIRGRKDSLSVSLMLRDLTF